MYVLIRTQFNFEKANVFIIYKIGFLWKDHRIDNENYILGCRLLFKLLKLFYLLKLT